MAGTVCHYTTLCYYGQQDRHRSEVSQNKNTISEVCAQTLWGHYEGPSFTSSLMTYSTSAQRHRHAATPCTLQHITVLHALLLDHKQKYVHKLNSTTKWETYIHLRQQESRMSLSPHILEESKGSSIAPYCVGLLCLFVLLFYVRSQQTHKRYVSPKKLCFGLFQTSIQPPCFTAHPLSRYAPHCPAGFGQSLFCGLGDGCTSNRLLHAIFTDLKK